MNRENNEPEPDSRQVVDAEEGAIGGVLNYNESNENHHGEEHHNQN